MLLKRLYHAADLAAAGAVLTNVALDASVNVSEYNHPAITPQRAITGGTTYTGAQIAAQGWESVASAWTTLETLIYTATTNDAFTYVTLTGDVQFSVQLAGWLTSGMVHSGSAASARIRNGGIVQILVNGAPVPAATTNLFEAVTTITVPLDGASGHTVTVRFTGQWGAGLNPIGPVAPLVGTSVSGGISTAPSTAHRTLNAASWRILATTSGGAGTGQYSVYTTPTGGTESLVIAGRIVGTAYDGSPVPGVILKLAGTITSGDSATFTTDSVMAAVLSMTASQGISSTTGTYASPVIDSMDPAIDTAGLLGTDTHWFALRMEASDLFTGATTPPSLALSIGDTPVPDASWHTYTALLVDGTDPVTNARTGTLVAGFPYATGDGTPARGRFAQFALNFPTGLLTTPWIRNFDIFYWVPERDPQLMNKLMPWGIEWTPGPNLQAIAGTWATLLTATKARARDYAVSATVGNAVDQYLAQWAVDLGLPSFAYSGIPQATLQQFARAALGSRPSGGTPKYMASQLGLIVGGIPPTTSVVTASDLQTATASSSALTTGDVVVAQTGPWLGTISIPPPSGSGPTASYPGMPGVTITRAQDWLNLVIKALSPNGVDFTATTTFN